MAYAGGTLISLSLPPGSSSPLALLFGLLFVLWLLIRPRGHHLLRLCYCVSLLAGSLMLFLCVLTWLLVSHGHGPATNSRLTTSLAYPPPSSSVPISRLLCLRRYFSKWKFNKIKLFSLKRAIFLPLRCVCLRVCVSLSRSLSLSLTQYFYKCWPQRRHCWVLAEIRDTVESCAYGWVTAGAALGLLARPLPGHQPVPSAGYKAGAGAGAQWAVATYAACSSNFYSNCQFCCCCCCFYFALLRFSFSRFPCSPFLFSFFFFFWFLLIEYKTC